MKYAYTIIYVENVTETIQFYEQAFGFQRKFITPEKDYGELDTGGTTISFASLELGTSNFSKGIDKVDKTKKTIGIELAFTTEDIEVDFHNAIDHGAIIFEKIVQKPWGQKVGYLRDINGVLIEICTPMKSD